MLPCCALICVSFNLVRYFELIVSCTYVCGFCVLPYLVMFAFTIKPSVRMCEVSPAGVRVSVITVSCSYLAIVPVSLLFCKIYNLDTLTSAVQVHWSLVAANLIYLLRCGDITAHSLSVRGSLVIKTPESHNFICKLLHFFIQTK